MSANWVFYSLGPKNRPKIDFFTTCRLYVPFEHFGDKVTVFVIYISKKRMNETDRFLI